MLLQVFVGGSICRDGAVKVTEDVELKVRLRTSLTVGSFSQILQLVVIVSLISVVICLFQLTPTLGFIYVVARRDLILHTERYSCEV